MADVDLVVEERLAVIRRDHDQRVVEEVVLLQEVDELADLLIDEAQRRVVVVDDLRERAVLLEPQVVVVAGRAEVLHRVAVGVRGVGDHRLGAGQRLLVLRLALVRTVRVERVQEEEERLVLVVDDPLVHLLAVPPEAVVQRVAGLTAEVVAVETLPEAVLRLDVDAIHKRRGGVALTGADLSEGIDPAGEHVAVEPHPVRAGMHAGHHRHVRRQGVRRLRHGVVEDHRLARELLEARRGRTRIAVQTEMVLAHRVERDEDHATGAAGGRSLLVRAAGDERRDDRDGDHDATMGSRDRCRGHGSLPAGGLSGAPRSSVGPSRYPSSMRRWISSSE